METAVRLQREREEAEAARAEQLRKEVRGPADAEAFTSPCDGDLARSLTHGAQPTCGEIARLHAGLTAAQPELEYKLLLESGTPRDGTS